MKLLTELHYLPTIDYFIDWAKVDEVYLEACETYQKQSYRNRSTILGSGKVETLTIPVLRSNTKQFIKEVEIDYSQSWQKNHWRSIQTAYGKAPYFEYYADYLQPHYQTKTKFLWDFNFKILTVCLQLLGVEKNILETKIYNKKAAIDVLDYIDRRNYVEPGAVLSANLTPYTQVFGNKFVPHLSIIDLIMNEGPASKAYLHK